MTFQESLRTCVIEKYFRISGRASRSEFWWFHLLVYALWLVPSVAQFGLQGIPIAFGVIEYPANSFDFFSMPPPLAVFVVGASLALLVLTIPSITVSVRRFHDLNLSGWWFLLYFTAALGPLVITSFYLNLAFVILYELVFIVAMAWPGTKTENRFGPNPSQPQDRAEVFA